MTTACNGRVAEADLETAGGADEAEGVMAAYFIASVCDCDFGRFPEPKLACQTTKPRSMSGVCCDMAAK